MAAPKYPPRAPVAKQHLSGWSTLLVFTPLLLVLVAAAAVGIHLAVTESSGEAGPAALERRTTCWDGASASSPRRCAPLEGTDGLAWVYPSFDPADPECEDRSGDRRQRWVCRDEVGGAEVYLTYSQLAGVGRGVRQLDEEYGSGDRSVQAVGGGRRPGWLVWDLTINAHHSRTVMHPRVPYAVTIWAVDRDQADLAIADLVEMRRPGTLARRTP